MKNKQLYKQALRLAVPIMIQNGITNMVNLVDNVMVGSTGTEAMTGVSIIGQLLFVFNLAIFGGFAGAGIYGAQYFGQKNKEGFQQAVRMKLWIGLVCLISGMAVFILGDDILINLYMRGENSGVNPQQTIGFAKQYLYIMLWGLPPFVLTQVYATSLRETGESVMPMISGVVSVIVDIVFNYLLIYGKFGFPKLGVEGAAIATVMARYAELCVVLAATYLKRKHDFMYGLYKKLLVPKEVALKFIRKSAPMFLNELLWAGSCAAVTQVYASRGLEMVAGVNISNAICNVLTAFYLALGSAIGIMTGHILGTGDFKKAKKDATSLTFFTAACCIVLSIVIIPISRIFPEFYNTTDEVKHIAKAIILVNAALFPVYGALNSIYFTLRSGGKMLITFLFDGAYSWAVAMPVAFVLCNFTDMNVIAVFACVQSAEILKLIVGSILLKKGVWISNLTEEAAA